MGIDLNTASRAEVEEEIAQVHIYLSRLKTHLNTSISAGRLPPEILSEIFLLLAHIGPANARQWKRSARPISLPSCHNWFPVTQVCRYWRDVASRLSILWSYINLNNRKLAELMSTKSQTAPLHVFCHLRKGDDLKPQVYNLLNREKHRVRWIQVVSRHYLDYDSHPLFSIHFPAVQSIAFLLSERPAIALDENYLGGQPFSSWMSADYSGLQDLSLLRCSLVTVKSSSRPSIRRLSLRKIPCSVPMPELLALLEQMPLLEHLSLDKVLPCVPYDAVELVPEPRKLVNLSNLRFLHVSSFGLSPGNFLHHLLYPPTASLFIEADCGFARPLIIPDVFVSSLIARLRGCIEATGERCLRSAILSESKGMFELLAWTSNTADIPSIPFESAQITLRISREHGFPQFAAITAALIGETLYTLHVGVSNLETVVLSAHNLRILSVPFMEDLRQLSSKINPSSISSVYPHLTMISLEELDEDEASSMNCFLENWHDSGQKLQTLSIQSCNNPSRVKEHLVARLEIRSEDCSAQAAKNGRILDESFDLDCDISSLSTDSTSSSGSDTPSTSDFEYDYGDDDDDLQDWYA